MPDAPVGREIRAKVRRFVRVADVRGQSHCFLIMLCQFSSGLGSLRRARGIGENMTHEPAPAWFCNMVIRVFRIARRVSYFSCGWPGQLYPGTGRLACALLSLPLNGRRRGAPGPALRRVLNDMRAGRVMRCTQFFDVCAIYDSRNEIVHQGQLRAGQDRPGTWFIAAQLLGSVLAWFAAHPGSDLSDLDAEIAALPTPPA